MNPLAASLDAKNFHDPWEFLPERWLGDTKQDDVEASQPFSLGSRGCMGKRYVLIIGAFFLSLRHTAVPYSRV